MERAWMGLDGSGWVLMDQKSASARQRGHLKWKQGHFRALACMPFPSADDSLERRFLLT